MGRPPPVPPQVLQYPPNQEALEEAAIPEGKMAGGGCKQQGGGSDLSPWCPGSLATGWGWRKASLNGVSVKTGKTNTSA